MLMKLRWFSRAEDRLDEWVTRQYQERVLDGRTAPVGVCPGEAFLESVARQSKQIALSDPRVDHAANCPVCMRRLLELRSQHQSRRRRLVFTSAVGCCLDCRRIRRSVMAWNKHAAPSRQYGRNS